MEPQEVTLELIVDNARATWYHMGIDPKREQGRNAMHTRLISKKPQVMQSGLEVKMEFKVTLTDQIVRFFFNKSNQF